jgi:hypothetical protein
VVDPVVLRNRVARIISVTRFPFVDQENWPEDARTIVNDETKRFGVKLEGGVEYPSIVVLNGDGTIREFGLVEHPESITEGSVARWRMLSDCAPRGRRYKKLFLYVPQGCEEKTLQLLEANDIDYDGIRGYSIHEGSLRITPFKTLNDEYDHQAT